MTNQNLSIRNWSVQERWEKKQEINALLLSCKYSTNQYGYIFLERKRNKPLFRKLNDFGIFDFHISNNGKYLYMHQIILYLHYGYKFYIQGKVAEKGKWEIHHKDHNPQNNNPRNLCYVNPDENKLLSACVGGFYLGEDKQYYQQKLGKFDISKFNIRNNISSFLQLLSETIYQTLNKLNLTKLYLPVLHNSLNQLNLI